MHQSVAAAPLFISIFMKLRAFNRMWQIKRRVQSLQEILNEHCSLARSLTPSVSAEKIVDDNLICRTRVLHGFGLISLCIGKCVCARVFIFYVAGVCGAEGEPPFRVISSSPFSYVF